VLPLGSVGSTVIDPIALVGMSPVMNVHFGLWASASFDRQTPPPAAATYSGHFFGLHFGSTARTATRPDYCVPRW
jgi:hypothetical protein